MYLIQFGKVLAGGTSGNDSILEIDPVPAHWHMKSPKLPRSLSKSACVTGSDGTLYLLGGEDYWSTISFKVGDTAAVESNGGLENVLGKS